MPLPTRFLVFLPKGRVASPTDHDVKVTRPESANFLSSKVSTDAQGIPALPAPTLQHPDASRRCRCRGLVCTHCPLTGGSDDTHTSGTPAFSRQLPPIWAIRTIQAPGPSSSSRGRLAPSSAMTSLSLPGRSGLGHDLSQEHWPLQPLSMLDIFLIRKKKKTFESFYLKC